MGEAQDGLERMTADEIVTTISIALAVVHPRVQLGRGRKLPHESDKERRMVAEILLRQFELSGIRWLRPPVVMSVPPSGISRRPG